jgi:hypothetical protein
VAPVALYTTRFILARNSFGQVNKVPIGYTAVLRHIDVWAGALGSTFFQFYITTVQIMDQDFVPGVTTNPLTWDGYAVVQQNEEFGFEAQNFGVDVQATGYLFNGVSPLLEQV